MPGSSNSSSRSSGVQLISLRTGALAPEPCQHLLKNFYKYGEAISMYLRILAIDNNNESAKQLLHAIEDMRY